MALNFLNDGYFAGKVGIGAESPSVALQLGNSTLGQTKLAIFNSEGGGEVGLTIQSRTNRAKLRVADNDSNAYVVAEAGKAFYGTSASGDATNITVLTSGNVGIGATTPVLKLEVQGTASTPTPFGSAAVNGVVRIASGSTNPILDIGSNSAAPYEMWLQAHVPANTYGTPISLQPLGGNVGIGTTSPTFQLSIENHATTTSTATLEIDGKRTNGTDGPVGEMIFSNNGDTFATVAGFRDGADNKGSLQFQTQDSTFATRMTISSEGNVGIGTTSPDVVLHIKKDDAPATFEIQGGLNTQTTAGAINGEINFGVNDPSTTGGIGASIKNISQISNGAHNGLAFFTGLQSRTPYLQQMLYFTAQGGLSFGTTNTAYGTSGQILKSNADAPPSWVNASAVIGGPYLPLTAGSGERVTGDLYISDKLYMRPSSTYGDGYNVMTVTGTNSAPYTSTLSFSNYAQSNVMVIQGSNVGIGVTGPGVQLEVGKSATIGAGSVTTSTTNHENVLKVKGKNNYSDGTTWYGDYGQILLSADSNMTGSAHQFLITNALNNNKFAIVRSVDANTVPVVSSTANGVNSGTADFVIDGAGNVGIGTETPDYKLEVQGVISSADSALQKATFANVGADLVLTANADATNVTAKILFNSSGSGGAGVSTKMIIDGSGNVGIGTGSTVSEKLTLQLDTQNQAFSGKNGTDYLWFLRNEAGAGARQSGRFQLMDTNVTTVNIESASNRDTFFNAGKVGIGTTSPGNLLDVAGDTDISGQLFVTHDANYVAKIKQTATSMSNASYTFEIDSTSHTSNMSTAGAMSVDVDSGRAFTITGSGLVGIGTNSPSSYDAESNNLVVFEGVDGTTPTPGITIACGGNQGSLGRGAIRFADGTSANDAYRGAVEYNHPTNSMSFRTDSSTRMTIDSNGKVGIGTTNPTFQLSIENHATTSSIATFEIDGKRTNGTDGAVGEMIFSNNGDTFATVAGFRDGADSKGSLQFQTQDSSFATRMTISSEGNVGIGTTSPDKTLTVGGTNTTHGIDIKTKIGTTVYKLWEAEQFFSDEGYQGIYYQNVKKIQFRANGDSYLNGGNVGINDTSPSNKLDVNGDIRATQYNLRGNVSNPTSTAVAIYDQASVGLTLSAHNTSFRSYDGSNMMESARLVHDKLTVAGDVIAYGSPSDKRLKENIKPIKSALDKVSKLQGVTFDWKEKGITNLKEDIGFIAQDVQKVVPELVRENEDGMLSMRHQGVAPILLEAIKELKAEIDLLKSKPCTCNKCNCNI